MLFAETKITNNNLFGYPKYSDDICDVIDCIASNRPLKDINEVEIVASLLSDILDYMEHACAGDRRFCLNDDRMISALRGQEQLLQVTALLSKRVEQYLTMQATGQEVKK